MSLVELQLARAARLVRAAGADERGGALPQALLDGLADVVPNDCACFHDLAPRQRRSVAFQTSRPRLPHDWDDPASRTMFWRLFPQIGPLRYLCQDGLSRGTVVSLSDFTPAPALDRTELYQEYLRPRGYRYAVVVGLPAAPGRARGVTLFRYDADFGEAERALLTLLRPHLYDAYRARQRRGAGIADLTPRQRQVLRCVALGYSTDRMAAAMGVSRSTVRKHLENIYARLGVGGRAAAVARVFAGDVLAGDGGPTVEP